jgi:hypothetical protein
MFSRKFASTGLALSFVALCTLGSIACSEQAQPSPDTTAQQPVSTQQQAVNADQLAKQAADRQSMSREERLKSIKADPVRQAQLQAQRDAARKEYAEQIAKVKDSIGQPPPQAKADPNRELLGFHKYLAEKVGIKFNWPQEMPNGTDLLKAADVIQMTLDDPRFDKKRMAIMVAKYGKQDNQSLGLDFMMKLTADGRTKAYSVGSYNLLVKGGDDNFHNTLKAALEQFSKKS